MAVELILMEDVKDLGGIGDTVKVADGYARNYLIPRKLATKVTPGILRQLESRKRVKKEKLEAEVVGAEALAAKITKHSISIPVQATEEDKLYGSITTNQVAEALQEMDFDIDPKQIVLDDAIKELGVYDVEIRLHRDVSAVVKLWVVKA
jgi:large subunit ribosomal protein L9